MLVCEDVVDWHFCHTFLAVVCVGTVILCGPIFWNPFLFVSQRHETCRLHGMGNTGSCLLDCDTE